MKLIEVVVYLKQDYSKSESLYVRENLTKDQITKAVNKKYNYIRNYARSFKFTISVPCAHLSNSI